MKAYLILFFYFLFSLFPLPKQLIQKNRQENEGEKERFWKEEKGRYVEKQSALSFLRYGWKSNAAYSSCGVIAVHNALQFFQDKDRVSDFYELLSLFERKGLTLWGKLGTSPLSMLAYFRKKGYDTKRFIGKNISEENVRELQGEYPVFLYTMLNNREKLSDMVHSICITREKENCYVNHNDYDGTRIYPTLWEAVSRYNDGKCEPVYLCGIRKKNVREK